jgi:hypothetical protein
MTKPNAIRDVQQQQQQQQQEQQEQQQRKTRISWGTPDTLIFHKDVFPRGDGVRVATVATLLHVLPQHALLLLLLHRLVLLLLLLLVAVVAVAVVETSVTVLKAQRSSLRLHLPSDAWVFSRPFRYRNFINKMIMERLYQP